MGRRYDVAGRLIEREVTEASTTWLAERITYGQGAPSAVDRNQLGRVILIEDASGTLATPRYGAFGEVLESTRTLTAAPGTDPDWSSSVTLEGTSHTSTTSYDALGRPTLASLPDGTERRFMYLQSGPTSTLEVVTPDTTVHTILAVAEYNARGQEVHRSSATEPRWWQKPPGLSRDCIRNISWRPTWVACMLARSFTMVAMTPDEWNRLGRAIVAWSGWGLTTTPARRWEVLEEQFGAHSAVLGANIRELEAAFYASRARYTAVDLVEMGAMASREFTARYPDLPIEAVEALAWCYTLDYR